MEEARRLLKESREFLDCARKDLEECQKIQASLLEEQKHAFEGEGLDEEAAAGSKLSEEESLSERRPRVASEALVESKLGFVLLNPAEAPGNKGSDEEEEDEALEVNDEDADSDDEDVPIITSGLNINRAEDQIRRSKDSEKNPADSPAPSYIPRASFGDEDDEDDDEEVELLLLAPPSRPNSLLQQMSMRTLRTPAEVKVGDGEADPDVVAQANQEASKLVPEATLEMVNRRGVLTKLPSTVKPFARPHSRFFILEGSILLYCTSPSSNIPRKMINLYGASCKLGKRKDSFRIHVCPRVPEFGTVPPTLIIATKSEEEARGWVSAIANNIECAFEKEEIRKAEKRLGQKKDRRTSHIGKDITERPDVLPKSLYDTLGVPPDATIKQIRVTYYGLAQKFHPDKNPDIDTNAFAEIGAAYHILKDKKLRASYDLCETVKAAFRLGVLAIKHEEDGSNEQMAFFLDRHFENLFWQKPEQGSVLRPGYHRIELRYVNKIFAGENDDELPVDDDARPRCVTLQMAPHAKNNLNYPTLFLELDTQEARDDILDGLRVLRCGASMLFQQNLDEMKANGLR